MTEIIVIGGGPAGVTAALKARELGASVTLIERGRMGGTCTNDGCVPTRVLAHTARLLRESRQFSEYGLVGEAPSLDFQKVMQRASQVVYTIHEKKQLIGHLADVGVHVFSEVGDAHFIDSHTIGLQDGRRFTADKFILCAGGRARRLDFPGAELALTHSDVWSMTEQPGSVIIVGAAATGCQLASIFSDFGGNVTMLERGPRILQLEDRSISRVMTAAFKSRGIKCITHIDGVENIKASGKQKILTYKKDDQILSIKADAVIMSAGWVGNLSSLKLDVAGVMTSGPYVRVNDYLQSNVEHIFAAGDINGRMMLVQSAGSEALAAAENAVLGADIPHTHSIVPHGGFTDPEYGSVGLTDDQAQAEESIVVATADYREMDRAVIDGRTEGICKLIVSAEDHRILGAHVVGEGALEVVHIAAASMTSRMWIEQLAELQIAYPTYTAIIGLAARKIVRQLGVTPLSSEWRSLERIHKNRQFRAEWEIHTANK